MVQRTDCLTWLPVEDKYYVLFDKNTLEVYSPHLSPFYYIAQEYLLSGGCVSHLFVFHVTYMPAYRSMLYL